MTDVAAGGISTATAPTHYVTRDEEVIDHWISDAQLMTLARGGKDRSFDVALAASGAALGFFQNFISVLVEVNKGGVLNAGTLSGAFAFVVAVTTAALAFWSYVGTKKDVDDLVKKIKSRTPSVVT